MKIRTLVLMSVFTGISFAQYTPPRFEVFGQYSYLHFNPTLTGLQSRSFNGGGGGVQVNFGRFLGIKAEFMGYGSTRWTVTNPAPIVTTQGTIPTGVYTSNGNIFTYLFGPVVGIHAKRFNVFGEVLFGGSNSNGYAKLDRSVVANGGTISVSGTQHPFTMAVGGGVDLNLSKLLAVRLGEVDYVLTRFTNPFTNTNNQNNYRYVGGIVFKFGGTQ
jgi:hypothetical protein